MSKTIRKDWRIGALLIMGVVFTCWWLVNTFVIGNDNIRYDTFWDFGDFYGLIALFGGICGMSISSKWGGLKSVMGRAIFVFSLGLFAQEFGQVSYALYYDLYKVPGPYPSLGDVGFFGSVLLYIYGIFLLAKASGVKIKLQSFSKQIQSVLIPLVVLFIGYYLFLRNYTFDRSDPTRIFLDFGYPFGQAIYISLAILTYLLSKGILGGVMKNKILIILLALCVQFLSDYTFLYQSSQGTWTVGGINDFMYMVAYFIMTLGLLKLSADSIKESNSEHN